MTAIQIRNSSFVTPSIPLFVFLPVCEWVVALSGYRISNAIDLILLKMQGFTKNGSLRIPFLLFVRLFVVFLFSV